MALPSSGAISIYAVAVELGIGAANLSLNDSRVRALAGTPSGAVPMSNLRGKSNATTISVGRYNGSDWSQVVEEISYDYRGYSANTYYSLIGAGTWLSFGGISNRTFLGRTVSRISWEYQVGAIMSPSYFINVEFTSAAPSGATIVINGAAFRLTGSGNSMRCKISAAQYNALPASGSATVSIT